ncbi:MAG: U32 family peptidase [bacterium]|nr:U32 family peptidase [Candidatus Margulisiibacteriota bacterium]
MPANPELLSPAGDLEKLEAAVRFGADAVYVGAGPFSLRAQATSFNLDELKQGISFAHQHKVKVYLAINIFAFDEDLNKMVTYLKEATKAGIDAAIISDPGLIKLTREKFPKLKIHLSTQANTLNSEAVKFWQQQGVGRVVLGREISLAQAKKIKKAVPKIELELFVHGAMCISYAGRCLLSKHMTNRSANRGECTQPCRWEYRLKEVTRPDDEFLIEQDGRSTYILNSKDLCLVEHIPKLIEAGIDSFKVEGRMKSVYYAALVTKIYREAIDATPKLDPAWKAELEKTSHRHFTTGFYLDEDETEHIADGSNIRNYTFVGVVANHQAGEIEIMARNYFAVGDELDIIDPKFKEIRKLKVTKIRTADNKEINKAHNNFHVFVRSEFSLLISAFSLLRRKSF